MFLSEKNTENEVFFKLSLALPERLLMFQSTDGIGAFSQKEKLGSTTFSTRCAFSQCSIIKSVGTVKSENTTKHQLLYFLDKQMRNSSQAGLYK